MIPITTAEHCRLIDQQTIADDGLPGIALMENAGAEVASAALSMLKGVPCPRVDIFCGPGNNGGDGFVVARHLQSRGVAVRVICTQSHDQYQGDALAQLNVLKHCGILPLVLDLAMIPSLVSDADLSIDALLGTGIQGEAKGLILEMIRWLNASGKPILSVDIASGLLADEPQQVKTAIRADLTLSIGALKLAQIFAPACDWSGRVQYTSIGFPRHRLLECPWHLVEKEDVMPYLPIRHSHGHKGKGGKLLVWAGSLGMMGAGALVCQAAQRMGCAMVQWICPQSLAPIAQTLCPTAMVLPLPEQDGQIDTGLAQKILIERLPWCDALVIGPGIGKQQDTEKLLDLVLPEVTKPILIDADGLNLLAQNPNWWKNINERCVLTPHRGEALRLFGELPADGKQGMVWVGKMAYTKKIQLHLKGSPSLTAASNGEVFVNGSGNSILSTAGSGDVLSGMMGSLLAMGIPSLLASVMAAYLHGSCADLLLQQEGSNGHTAEDLVRILPQLLNVED